MNSPIPAPDTSVSSLPPLTSTSKIIILGSGVFGLSTAFWLRQSGYENVTVFDMQDTARHGYSPSAVDSASADLNKIIRFSYGAEIEYQRLATEAAALWDEWNAQIASVPEAELPASLRGGERRLWWNSGMLRMTGSNELPSVELQTLENMAAEGLRDGVFRSDDENDLARARERGWAHKIDPCHRADRFGVHMAVLDSTAGFVVAYKSCAWARYLAEKAGVKFILGPSRGKAVRIATEEERPTIHTADGETHSADRVIVACGGWTPSLLPGVTHLLEATAGSVTTVQLPQTRPDLWERFSPENFPVITLDMTGGAGLYSLPRTEDGVVKVAYRGTKYTNYATVNGSRISVPKTANVTEEKETNIPLQALDAIKSFIADNLPELTEFGISSTKLCWYTDSIDNSFLIDYVPDRPGVFVCSGGSGHGFKFLPILGREVVKILRGSEPTVYRDMWKWRDSPSDSRRNGLEEGEAGPRVLAKQTMATERDWAF
ncbi:FAD dependent oxidoreductase [Coniochaeta sp. PMI_546]|nr:FAD dependent oxidoreductase [Coniochaeta sp. PMI_546]